MNSEGPARAAEFVSGCINGNYSPNASAEEAGDCLPVLTLLPAAARACLQDVYFPSAGSPGRAVTCQGNPQTPLPAEAAAGFTSSPAETHDPLEKPPCHHPAPLPAGPWGALGEGPQDVPGLMKALTATTVIFFFPRFSRKKGKSCSSSSCSCGEI